MSNNSFPLFIQTLYLLNLVELESFIKEKYNKNTNKYEGYYKVDYHSKSKYTGVIQIYSKDIFTRSSNTYIIKVLTEEEYNSLLLTYKI